MKIFVTGANGFLGQHLIPKLSEHQLLAPRSNQVDLMNYQQVEHYIRRNKPEIVIHLAAHYGGLGINHAEPDNLFFYNTIMATNLFDAAARNDVRKIIPMGSSCSYPALLEDLKEEDFWNGRCHDSVEAYGFSKKLQLVGLTAYRKVYGTDFCHLVLTNMYGEHDDYGEYRGHAISVLIKKFADATRNNSLRVECWGDGTQVREFLYVGDAAEAIVKFIYTSHCSDLINIGTGEGISIGDLVAKIVEITGYKGRVKWLADKPSGVSRKVMDIAKMKSTLHWEPKMGLDEGLEKTIRWYRETYHRK